MCNVKYGVMWNVLSWYVECCIMQNVESYVKCGGVELWLRMWHMQCAVQLWNDAIHGCVMSNQDVVV